MLPSLSALDAACLAIQGSSDVDNILPALNNELLSTIIALAPKTHPDIRSIAALSSGYLPLVDTQAITERSFHTKVLQTIETHEGYSVLERLANVARAGWGSDHTVRLVEATQNGWCDRGAAAALIGPCDESAKLLFGEHASFAIFRWGLETPDDPTAWMNSLSPEQRSRLIRLVACQSYNVARCLPWLPPGTAEETPIDNHYDVALHAFGLASETARERHAARLQGLLESVVQEKPSMILSDLTFLACATKSKEVWRLIGELVKKAPHAVDHVVLFSQRDDLPKTVLTTITSLADLSDECAAIAAAQGQKVSVRIYYNSASCFFATLDPKVWDGLTVDEQISWLSALPNNRAYFAVQSLGPRPDILAKAEMSDRLIRAVQRHVRDDDELRAALFPIALRELSPDMARTIWNALPRETQQSLHAHPAIDDWKKTVSPAPSRRIR